MKKSFYILHIYYLMRKLILTRLKYNLSIHKLLSVNVQFLFCHIAWLSHSHSLSLSLCMLIETDLPRVDKTPTPSPFTPLRLPSFTEHCQLCGSLQVLARDSDVQFAIFGLLFAQLCYFAVHTLIHGHTYAYTGTHACAYVCFALLGIVFANENRFNHGPARWQSLMIDFIGKLSCCQVSFPFKNFTLGKTVFLDLDKRCSVCERDFEIKLK